MTCLTPMQISMKCVHLHAILLTALTIVCISTMQAADTEGAAPRLDENLASLDSPRKTIAQYLSNVGLFLAAEYNQGNLDLLVTTLESAQRDIALALSVVEDRARKARAAQAAAVEAQEKLHAARLSAPGKRKTALGVPIPPTLVFRDESQQPAKKSKNSFRALANNG